MIVKLTSDREEEVEPWQAQINVAAAAVHDDISTTESYSIHCQVLGNGLFVDLRQGVDTVCFSL
jgi:hypothetical protein